MDQIIEKLQDRTNKSNGDALELASQKHNIPIARSNGEHPFVLMRGAGIKVYDDKSNVVEQTSSVQSGKNVQPFEKNVQPFEKI